MRHDRSGIRNWSREILRAWPRFDAPEIRGAYSGVSLTHKGVNADAPI